MRRCRRLDHHHSLHAALMSAPLVVFGGSALLPEVKLVLVFDRLHGGARRRRVRLLVVGYALILRWVGLGVLNVDFLLGQLPLLLLSLHQR